jgi:hypothetical protein
VTDQLLFKLEELAAAGTAMSQLRVNQSCAHEVTLPKKKSIEKSLGYAPATLAVPVPYQLLAQIIPGKFSHKTFHS